jgi:hypothetical protein
MSAAKFTQPETISILEVALRIAGTAGGLNPDPYITFAVVPVTFAVVSTVLSV